MDEAMTRCGQCREPMSREAITCPHCGSTTLRGYIAQAKWMAVLLVVGLVAATAYMALR